MTNRAATPDKETQCVAWPIGRFPAETHKKRDVIGLNFRANTLIHRSAEMIYRYIVRFFPEDHPNPWGSSPKVSPSVERLFHLTNTPYVLR